MRKDEKEIRELVSLAADGDEDAAEQIIARCEPLTRSVTRRFHETGIYSRQDIVQEAALALLEAVRAYSGAYSFFAFASVYIDRHLCRALPKARAIHIPQIGEYYRARKRCDEDGVSSTPENIATRAFRMSANLAGCIEVALALFPYEERMRVGEFRPTENLALQKIWREEFWANLESALIDLPQRETQIVHLRVAGATHREIAALLGGTEASSQAVFARAKGRLRAALGNDWKPNGRASRGVQRNGRKWAASIYAAGKAIFLGNFRSEAEAAKAYGHAANNL